MKEQRKRRQLDFEVWAEPFGISLGLTASMTETHSSGGGHRSPKSSIGNGSSKPDGARLSQNEDSVVK